MSKESEFKVVVINPPTEQQKEEIMKRVEDYLKLIYTKAE